MKLVHVINSREVKSIKLGNVMAEVVVDMAVVTKSYPRLPAAQRNIWGSLKVQP